MQRLCDLEVTMIVLHVESSKLASNSQLMGKEPDHPSRTRADLIEGCYMTVRYICTRKTADHNDVRTACRRALLCPSIRGSS